MCLTYIPVWTCGVFNLLAVALFSRMASVVFLVVAPSPADIAATKISYDTTSPLAFLLRFYFTLGVLLMLTMTTVDVPDPDFPFVTHQLFSEFLVSRSGL